MKNELRRSRQQLSAILHHKPSPVKEKFAGRTFGEKFLYP